MSQQQGPLVVATTFDKLVAVFSGNVVTPGAGHESRLLAKFEPWKFLQPRSVE